MAITESDVIAYIYEHGENGVLELSTSGQEEVVVRTDVVEGERIEVKEVHDFKYSRILLYKEDMTEKKLALQKQLDALNVIPSVK